MEQSKALGYRPLDNDTIARIAEDAHKGGDGSLVALSKSEASFIFEQLARANGLALSVCLVLHAEHLPEKEQRLLFSAMSYYMGDKDGVGLDELKMRFFPDSAAAVNGHDRV